VRIISSGACLYRDSTLVVCADFLKLLWELLTEVAQSYSTVTSTFSTLEIFRITG